MKYNNLTFIIPCKLDSIIRCENVLSVMNFLSKICNNIIIYEIGKYNNHILEQIIQRKKCIKYTFITDYDPIFHRTRYLNMMSSNVRTQYIAVWDADVLVSYKQIRESMTALMSRKADISFPYDGTFFDVDENIRAQYIGHGDLFYLKRMSKMMETLYGENFVGGGFIINKDKYFRAGKENEKFYGWGPEDMERVIRWKNCKYTIHRSKGPMFHLYHPRDNNGYMRSNQQSDRFFMQLNESSNQ